MYSVNNIYTGSVTYTIRSVSHSDVGCTIYIERKVGGKHQQLWIGHAEHNGSGQADSAKRALTDVRAQVYAWLKDS
jgi:hypothetical protein